ncbi:DUF302 domain-containing protein [Gracilibacillus marinus]|uniref:DUF302 domain-containing protein n=1 Tax=Gracilibacillus marinus TaxID=630535 RepID=A0ABV8VP74_9BACI
MFHYTVSSNKSIEETIMSLEINLKSENFGVLWQFDIKDKLQEKGLSYNTDYIVLEVCNPVEAEKVLTENKLAGYFLPCKIVVYKEEEETKIGMPRPSELIRMVEDPELKEIAFDIEHRLIECIDKSK